MANIKYTHNNNVLIKYHRHINRYNTYNIKYEVKTEIKKTKCMTNIPLSLKLLL